MTQHVARRDRRHPSRDPLGASVDSAAGRRGGLRPSEGEAEARCAKLRVRRILLSPAETGRPGFSGGRRASRRSPSRRVAPRSSASATATSARTSGPGSPSRPTTTAAWKSGLSTRKASRRRGPRGVSSRRSRATGPSPAASSVRRSHALARRRRSAPPAVARAAALAQSRSRPAGSRSTAPTAAARRPANNEAPPAQTATFDRTRSAMPRGDAAKRSSRSPLPPPLPTGSRGRRPAGPPG